MQSRQKTTPPKTVASAGHAAGDQDDVARQIPVFRPQPVAHPRPDARPPESLKAGMQKQLSRGVIELFRSNRFHNSQFVRNRPHQRQVLGQLQPTLPMRVILESSPQQRRMFTDERQLLALEHVVGALLPVPLDQFRFVVEQLQVRRATDEVNIDNVLRPRGTMWFTREKRVYTGSREQVPVHRRGQAKRTNAGTGVFQKLAARLVQVIILLWSHRSAFHDRLVQVQQNVRHGEPLGQALGCVLRERHSPRLSNQRLGGFRGVGQFCVALGQ